MFLGYRIEKGGGINRMDTVQKTTVIALVVIVGAVAVIAGQRWIIQETEQFTFLGPDMNVAYGQNYEPLCLQNGAVLNKDENIVIIDMTVADNTKCIFNYAREGYEIKAIQANQIMFMQKVIK